MLMSVTQHTKWNQSLSLEWRLWFEKICAMEEVSSMRAYSMPATIKILLNQNQRYLHIWLGLNGFTYEKKNTG